MDEPIYADTLCRDGMSPPMPRRQRARGHSRIVLRPREGRTVLRTLYQDGSSKIRLPRLAGGPLEAVLINTAGGVTGGDRFAAEVVLEAGSHAVLTTQACERVYRSAGGTAEVTNRLEVGAGARLDWLPQETILFDGGRLSRRLDAELAEGSELLAVETTIFGRTAMGESVRTGSFRDRWRIRRQGRLLFADDLRLEGEIAGLIARPAVLDGNAAMATVLLVSEGGERLLDAVRSLIGEAGGASFWNGRLLARVTAPDGFLLRRILIPVLGVLMPGRSLPKVWQL